MKKRKPKFNVQNENRWPRIANRGSWRRPRGSDNKKRIRRKDRGASPRVGYKNSPNERSIHPSGIREVLIRNTSELEGLKGVAVRLSAGLSRRKKKEIAEKASSMGLRVLNW
ncbi:MAG: eL32 family ribosomal protein [Candidatus Anstonellales archaeon]